MNTNTAHSSECKGTGGEGSRAGGLFEWLAFTDDMPKRNLAPEGMQGWSRDHPWYTRRLYQQHRTQRAQVAKV